VVCVYVCELCNKYDWTNRDAVRMLDSCGYKESWLDGVKIKRIHSQPRGVTRRRCGLFPNHFGHLLSLVATAHRRPVASAYERVDRRWTPTSRRVRRSRVHWTLNSGLGWPLSAAGRQWTSPTTRLARSAQEIAIAVFRKFFARIGRH